MHFLLTLHVQTSIHIRILLLTLQTIILTLQTQLPTLQVKPHLLLTLQIIPTQNSLTLQLTW
jgi:hypothetical protein